jgi:hypothetical protein
MAGGKAACSFCGAWRRCALWRGVRCAAPATAMAAWRPQVRREDGRPLRSLPRLKLLTRSSVPLAMIIRTLDRIIRTLYRIISTLETIICTLETIICTRKVDLRKYCSCAMQPRRSVLRVLPAVCCLLHVARCFRHGAVASCCYFVHRVVVARCASCMSSIARCALRQADRAAYGTEWRGAVRMMQMRRSRAVNDQLRPG